jgi:hypothetical protein
MIDQCAKEPLNRIAVPEDTVPRAYMMKWIGIDTRYLLISAVKTAVISLRFAVQRYFLSMSTYASGAGLSVNFS